MAKQRDRKTTPRQPRRDDDLSDGLDRMTVDELCEIAQREDIKVGGLRSKPQLVGKLRKARATRRREPLPVVEIEAAERKGDPKPDDLGAILDELLGPALHAWCDAGRLKKRLADLLDAAPPGPATGRPVQPLTLPIPSGADIITQNNARVAVWTEDQPGDLPPRRRSAPVNDQSIGEHPPETRILVSWTVEESAALSELKLSQHAMADLLATREQRREAHHAIDGLFSGRGTEAIRLTEKAIKMAKADAPTRSAKRTTSILRDLERVRSYLLPDQHYYDETMEDAVAALRERRRELLEERLEDRVAAFRGLGDSSGMPGPPRLDEVNLSILKALRGAAPAALTAIDLERSPTIHRTVRRVSERLNRLETHGLVRRDSKRSGWTITDMGRNVINGAE